MAIQPTDIKKYLSGGSSNANPNASIGGPISSVEQGANIFDAVSGSEAVSGDVEYRCVYYKNTHPTLTYIGAKAFVQTNTPSPNTDVAIGLGASGLNGDEPAIANEGVAPSGVTFSSPTSIGTGLTLGDLAPGDEFPIWIRRTVDAGAGLLADGFTVRVVGDTNP